MQKNKRLLVAELLAAVLVAGLAFVFHFLYEWSGENFIVGLFAAKNESVFEHTKILFYPFIIVSIIEYFFVKVPLRSYIAAKALGAVLLVVLVITVFYTYSGIIGRHIAVVDMLCAVVYPFIAAALTYATIVRPRTADKLLMPALIAFGVVTVFMLIFTVNPPNISLFLDYSKG